MIQQLLKVDHQPIDYQYLKDLFSDYRYPRNKISSLLKSGQIIALKSGLYILSDQFGRNPVTEQVANLLYGPSYVSLDYALSYYGLIPERVYSISSVCTGRKKYFDTPLGRFTYQQLKPQYYSFGYVLAKVEDSSYMIATPEKALCDKLYLSHSLPDSKGLEQYLTEDLRMDYGILSSMDKKLISKLATLSGKRNLRILKELIS